MEPGRGRRDTGHVLVSSDGGYRLRIEPEATDLSDFSHLRAEARRQADRGHLRDAIDHWESALALWNGEAYEGVPGPLADLERVRLDELRLAATEEWAEAMLEVRRHADLTAPLYDICRREPDPRPGPGGVYRNEPGAGRAMEIKIRSRHVS